MGSISYQIPYGSSARKEVAKYVRDNFRGEFLVGNFAHGDPGGLKWGGWGGYYFAAHRLPDGTVYCSITAFGQDHGDVVIKAMDETVGPTAQGIGKKVLAALTPLSDDAHTWQQDWRREAHNYQEWRQRELAKRRFGSG
jgi:hypothetical protein